MATPEALPLKRSAPVASEAQYDKLSPGPGRSASEVGAHQRARIHSAMVEIVAERGYPSVTARELSRLSGVSSRAFYQHFNSKEDCFLRTYDLVVRRTARRVVAAQTGERDWQKRLRLAFNAFVEEVERKPKAAKLTLVDVYAAGPAALERVRRTERAFETMLVESFARAPDSVKVSPLLIEGVVAGTARVVRTRLLDGDPDGFHALGDELLDWALCYRSQSAATLFERDHENERGFRTDRHQLPEAEQRRLRLSTDCRDLILSATAKIAAAEGYDGLTIPRIRTAAGVSKKNFSAHFESVEDCFLTALELRANEVVSQAARAQASGDTWAGGVYQAIITFCLLIGRDPVLSSLCSTGVAAPSTEGVRRRESLASTVVSMLFRDSSAGYDTQQPARLALEASAGAIWSLLHHLVGRHPQHLPQIASTLAFLALAPITGAADAAEAIRLEQSK